MKPGFLWLCVWWLDCAVREGANPDPLTEMFKTIFSSVSSFVFGKSLQFAFNGGAHGVFLCFSDASSLNLIVI